MDAGDGSDSAPVASRPPAVVVEPGRAGNQKPAPRLGGVVQPFHEIPPAPVFVDFIEQDQGLIGGQLAPEEHLSRGNRIPREIGGMRLVAAREQTERKGRLSHLPRAGQNDHFSPEVRHDGLLQISFHGALAPVSPRAMFRVHSKIYMLLFEWAGEGHDAWNREWTEAGSIRLRVERSIVRAEAHAVTPENEIHYLVGVTGSEVRSLKEGWDG